MDRLNRQELFEAINAVVANARDLAEDARLLFTRGRFPTAHALGLLACEEYAKAILLVGALYAGDFYTAAEWSRLERQLSSHTSKLLVLTLLDAALSRNSNDKHTGIEPWLNQVFGDASTRHLMNKSKQFGLYVSFEDGHLHTPSATISAESAIEALNGTEQCGQLFEACEDYLTGKTVLSLSKGRHEFNLLKCIGTLVVTTK